MAGEKSPAIFVVVTRGTVPLVTFPLAFHKNGAYNKLVATENSVKKGEQYEYQRQNF